MNNKTYSKIRRKKSFASLILAFLLMLTFNSSPILLLASNIRNANAYKSSETKTYYTSKTNESETKFSDPNYPSSYKDYFSDSSKNFNLYTYYNTKFEELYFKYADEFLRNCNIEITIGTAGTETKYIYNEEYLEFLEYYGAKNLSEFFSAQKNESLLKANLVEVTPRALLAHLAIKGFKEYATDKTLPPVSKLIGDWNNLSNFYRMFANTIVEGNIDDPNYPVDGDDSPNKEIGSDEAFYKKPTLKDKEAGTIVGNSHYNRLVDFIDAEISKNVPIYAFDKETQDTNIAAIIANMVPTSVDYNYVSNSYVSYSEPSTSYRVYKDSTTGVEHKVIYYFGNQSGLDAEFVEDHADYLSVLSEGEKAEGDIFLYRPIQSGEVGYVADPAITTYYKYTSSPYLTTSSKKDIYVLTDETTSQDDLDTYSSVYFKTLTSSELNANKEYYVQIPYESDKLYFKAAYNDLYSNKGFYGSDSDEKFNTFVSIFTTLNSDQTRTSKLYVKVGTNTKKTVYIDENSYEEFMESNAGYAYKVEPIDTSTFKAEDYEKILKNSNNSAYFIEGYDLYFEKTKEYYTEPTTPLYDGTYETYYAPEIPLEMETVASTKYEMDNDERKIYIISELDDPTLTIKSIDESAEFTFTTVKETVVSANSDFYVKVPSYIYKDKNISDTYKLYYKHTATEAKKLYVVDNSDDAENNKVYQTLNFNVITISELKSNITNYVAVAEGDANYNENFQLYYKYDRTPDTSKVYVLNQPGVSLGGASQYKLVESSQLTDYALINKEENASLYETIKNAITLDDDNLEIELYYKLSGVFVQNKLKDGNAIYVLDTSVNKDEKETYSRLMYTPIGQSDIDNNPNLYVLIDSNDESNYFADYKLYYKYKTESTASRVIYTYETINKTAEDYNISNYELITPSNEFKDGDYVSGQELYYKKNIAKTQTVNITKPTYYYYQTTSTTTLSANSYYVVSFYVNTIGANAKASFGIKDTAKVIDDINVNNISTNGSWEKYYVFLSTNANTASTINLYLYLGDEENGVKGNTDSNIITGSVFFDDIKITKIGLTDFTKYAIDDIAIYSESKLMKDSNGETIENTYADEYNNRAIIANEDSRFNSENWDSRKFLNVDAYDNNKWNDIFNFDNTQLQTFLGKDTGVDADKIENQLEALDLNIDGYKMYDSSFTSLWRYYISRDLANDFSIDNYINAYNDGKLEVSTTNKIAESEEPEDDEEEENSDEDEEESSDIKYVSSPFNANNYALRLKNTSKDTALGITSNSFKVNQFEYYKITLWIYSPDLEGKATISLNSVLTDRQHPTYGSLLSTSISAVNANIENSTSSTSEYGWIPVSLYIEGNNFQDMACYLVLTAEKDCTVYFDNIKIEKTTSTQYDNAKSKSSSDKYIAALSLTPSSSLISSDITNGTFDYIKETETSHDVTSSEPFEPDNWTALSTNSTRTVSGIVSLQQHAFFNKYSINSSGSAVLPVEYPNDISNIFAIYSPKKVQPLSDKVYTPAEISSTMSGLIDYKHTYSIYSASMSLSANSVYKISFKFFKNDAFDGKIISNIYNSAVKTANVIATMEVEDSEFSDNTWHTLTYYIATSTSSQTVYLEIGVEDAVGACFFKSASAKKLTGKTINSIIQSEATKLGIDSNATENLYDAFKTIKFLDLANADLSYHSINVNIETELYDPLSFTDKSDVTTDHTAGKVGVTVASYFDTINHTTYTTTISEVTYHIGEVYELKVDNSTYYIHKTYNSAMNQFSYKMYSDSALTNEVNKINDKDFEILTTGTVKVQVDGTADPIETTTTYRLFKFSDLREEVTEIDGSEVSIPSLEKVVVGEGAHATDNAIISKQNTSYVYHFGTKADYEFNNNIISAKELENAQSANVMILANGHATDYITVSQSTTRTLGKSTYNVLRIYVKTSDFEDDNVGLNISVSAVNVEWKNINTTDSTQKDKYGFVCYEILVSSNSTDSISSFGVEFTLGNKNSSEVGYAIISKVSLDTISTKEEFEHYSAFVGDDNENIKKAIYADTASDESTDETEEADDKNSMSWATFFYVFSSILLVVTMAVAMIAIFLKKHPIKTSEKFENDHDRDIQTVSSKSKKASSEPKVPRTIRARKSKKAEVEIDLSVSESKSSKKDNGGIV